MLFTFFLIFFLSFFFLSSLFFLIDGIRVDIKVMFFTMAYLNEKKIKNFICNEILCSYWDNKKKTPSNLNTIISRPYFLITYIFHPNI